MMGLHIKAHRKLQIANGNEGFYETGEIKEENGWFVIYVNDDFPGRADEIKDRHAYKSEESFDFHAGSYHGYGHWRDQLTEMAGYPTTETDYPFKYAEYVWKNPESGPFMELINFSDCEGVIGAAISKKLAADFQAYQSKADEHPDEYFRVKYTEWRKAFEMAADGGCVRFM